MGDFAKLDFGRGLSRRCRVAQWGSAWPLLDEVNQQLHERGLPPLTLRAGSSSKEGKPPITEVTELMNDLVNEWVSHLTTRFDRELDAAWQVTGRTTDEGGTGL